MNTNRKLVKMDSVEGEVLVVNGVEGPAHDAGLDLVLLLWQQLQFNVGIAEMIKTDSDVIIEHGSGLKWSFLASKVK